MQAPQRASCKQGRRHWQGEGPSPTKSESPAPCWVCATCAIPNTVYMHVYWTLELGHPVFCTQRSDAYMRDIQLRVVYSSLYSLRTGIKEDHACSLQASGIPPHAGVRRLSMGEPAEACASRDASSRAPGPSLESGTDLSLGLGRHLESRTDLSLCASCLSPLAHAL